MNTDQFIAILKKTFENQTNHNKQHFDFKTVEKIFLKELEDQFKDRTRETRNEIEKIVQRSIL